VSSTYLIALGSNRRHHLYGSPSVVVRAAMEELAALGTVLSRSPLFPTDPLGPAQRRFANAACLIKSDYDPPSLLVGLKHIERDFGRRSWRRWGDRVIDLDIVLWSGGAFRSRDLSIPHPEFRRRVFVLAPAKAIAPQWRDPVSGLSISQLKARLTRAQAMPR
jgi:2-amino-4-hydroxy-6-hydroxymethyldihydropteridine diphosphokinase